MNISAQTLADMVAALEHANNALRTVNVKTSDDAKIAGTAMGRIENALDRYKFDIMRQEVEIREAA